MKRLPENPFHTVKNHVDAPNEKDNTLGQQCEFIRVLVTVVVRTMSRGGVGVLSLNGIFESDRQGDGDAC